MAARGVPQTFKEAFSGKLSFLSESIDTQHGLLNRLQDYQLLTRIQRDAIESKPTPYERCDEILRLLEPRNDSDVPKFLTALVATNQRHIVDHIVGYRTTGDEFLPPVTVLQQRHDQGPIDSMPVKYDYLVTENESEWYDVKLTIAVIGRAGQGKSTFINTIRNLKQGDEGAAPTGVIECVKQIARYEHPVHTNLLFFDIPGLGTKGFERSTYKEKVSLADYDFFLLLSANRFTEDDGWLGHEIEQMNKKYYFIRTKVDQDIANEKRNPKPRKPNDVLDEIRSKAIPEDVSTPMNAPIFLLDVHERYQFDFPKLESRLADDYPDLKRDAFIMTMESSNEDIIRRKADTLRKLIIPFAVSSCVVGLIPFPMPMPEVSTTFDMALIKAHASICHRALGLENSSLEKIARLYAKDFEQLAAVFRQQFGTNFFSPQGIEAFVNSSPSLNHAVRARVAEQIFHHIPFFGGIVGGPLSAATTAMISKEIVNKMEQVAIEISRIIKGENTLKGESP